MLVVLHLVSVAPIAVERCVLLVHYHFAKCGGTEIRTLFHRHLSPQCRGPGCGQPALLPWPTYTGNNLSAWSDLSVRAVFPRVYMEHHWGGLPPAQHLILVDRLKRTLREQRSHCSVLTAALVREPTAQTASHHNFFGSRSNTTALEWAQRLGADPWWRVDQYPNTWNVWRREASRAGISGEDLTKLFEGDRTPLVELPGESSSSRDEATECSQVGACSKQCASQVASWERRVLERIDLVAPLSAFNEFLLEVGRKIGLTTLPSGVLCRAQHAHAHVHLLGATAKDVARRNRSKAEGELLAAYAPCSRYAYWRWHFAGIDKLGKTLEARRRWCRERRMR